MFVGSHMGMIMQDGSVKMWGYNNYGQIGDGTTDDVLSPKTIDLPPVKQIALGDDFTVFLLKDGTIRTCGNNNRGQLGTGDTNDYYTPQDPGISGVKKISTGDNYLILLMEDGTVKGTGDNQCGTLGIDNTEGYSNSTPINIPMPMPVIDIACGSFHTIFLLEDGTIRTCGYNPYGQLGTGDEITYTTPQNPGLTNIKIVECGPDTTFCIAENGTIYGCGSNRDYGHIVLNGADEYHTFQPVTTISGDIKEFIVSACSFFVLFNDGTVKGQGSNYFNQLITNENVGEKNIPLTTSNITNVKQISCLKNTYYYLLNDGSLKSIGYNNRGQLGNGTTNNTATLQDIASNVDRLATEYLVKILLLYLINDNDNIKSYDYNNLIWNTLGQAPVTKTMFDSGGMDNLNLTKDELDLLSSQTPYLIAWTDDINNPKALNTTAIPEGQLILPDGDIDLSTISSIDSISLTSTESGSGIIRLIASADQGTTWQSWDGLNWVEVTLNVHDIKTNGMSPTTINNLTTTEWSSLISESNTLRFAYYLEVGSNTDVAETDLLEMTVDMHGKWQKAEFEEDYEYEYNYNDTMTVKLLKDGTYKINY